MQDWLVAQQADRARHGLVAHDDDAGDAHRASSSRRSTRRKGAEFDRQFLTLMIQHHEGALKMVADLLATPLAAQDVDVSVFANDVETVQTAEIDIMHQMLDQLLRPLYRSSI